MNKSESIAKLSKSLTAVQAALQPAAKDADNPFFKTKYADLNSVWDSCRELLAKNGLSVIQGNTVGADGTVIVETILAHESGEWVQSELALPLSKRDPQGVGSAITYGRRYGLASIVGIVADVDDDGNHASGKNGNTLPPRKPQMIENAGEVQAIQNLITKLCSELNKAGDGIAWSRTVLRDYAEQLNGKPYDQQNSEELKLVLEDLQGRLKAAQEAK